MLGDMRRSGQRLRPLWDGLARREPGRVAAAYRRRLDDGIVGLLLDPDQRHVSRHRQVLIKRVRRELTITTITTYKDATIK